VSYAGAPGPPPAPERRGDTPQNIATAVAEVSERATQLVHEEIELAKAELSEKVAELLRGAIVGAAAGLFFVMAVILGLVGFAWLLYWFLPVDTYEYFWGFFAMALILVVLGAIAGLLAAKIAKRGAPPVPMMAIDEARKIRETVSTGSEAGIAPGGEFPPARAGDGGPPPPPPPPGGVASGPVD